MVLLEQHNCGYIEFITFQQPRDYIERLDVCRLQIYYYTKQFIIMLYKHPICYYLEYKALLSLLFYQILVNNFNLIHLSYIIIARKLFA